MPLQPKQQPPYYTTERPKKIYKALISQSDEDAPTVIELQNTFGTPIIWTRTGIGTYLGTLTGAFTENKTFPIISNNAFLNAALVLTRASINTIELNTGLPDTTPDDSKLNNTPIEIQVFD